MIAPVNAKHQQNVSKFLSFKIKSRLFFIN